MTLKSQLASVLDSASFARIRFETVTRFTQNRPFHDFPQICVKPRKSNVSSLPKPCWVPWAARWSCRSVFARGCRSAPAC
jgi:hypothetical protein